MRGDGDGEASARRYCKSDCGTTGAEGLVKAELGRNLGEMLEPFESSESNAGSVGVRTRGEGKGDAYGDVEYAAR